jgi:hypothetical protein
MQEYINFRSNPANDHTTDSMWCEQRGISKQVLQQWKMANPGIMEKILQYRRARYADELIKIDAALLAKAKAGDAAAAKLCWARFEDWTPTVMENEAKKSGGKAKTLSELIAEADG